MQQNSDIRLKTNIQALDGSSSLAEIDNLNPVTFNWIDPEKSGVPQFGFIAQQVENIFPNLVATTAPTALTPDGTLSLNYIDLISPIIAAIQELDREITTLESTVAGFRAVDYDGRSKCDNGQRSSALPRRNLRNRDAASGAPRRRQSIRQRAGFPIVITI